MRAETGGPTSQTWTRIYIAARYGGVIKRTGTGEVPGPMTGFAALGVFRVPLQPLQIGSHFRRTLIAKIAIVLKCLVDDVFQLRGHVGIQTSPRAWEPRPESL